MTHDTDTSPEVETLDPWESGELGRDSKHVIEATKTESDAVDAALGMQMVSIRLSKALIRDLKMIAGYREIGYQPLVRDILCRFARSEMSQIAHELAEEQEARAKVEAAAARKRA